MMPEEKSMRGMPSMMGGMGGMMIGKFILALVVVGAGMGLYKYWVALPDLPRALTGDDVKAVFLDTGQVYFGELEVVNKDFLLIEDPYYLQTRTVLQEPVEEGAEPQQRRQLSLAALGGPGLQIHGPERAMYIPWESVQYIENLRDDSEVVKLIKSEQQKSEEEKSGEVGKNEEGQEGQ